MGTASPQYPFGISPHFHGNSAQFSPKLDSLSVHFPLRGEILGSSTSSCTSKGCVGRIYSLPNFDEFSWEKGPTPILDTIENPMHLKNLSPKELKQLADDIRSELSFIMSKTQKPLKASLAAVELTIALHYVFHAPMDKILWDVGAQTYAHKILTGRRSLMHTLREKDGVSGYTSRFESEFDPFGAAHGCNSVSAGLGLAVARDIKAKRDRIVTVISNGATMAGQLYEAMTNAGYLDSDMIVILNDSRHSLRPKIDGTSNEQINALSSTLIKLQSSKFFRRFREALKGLTKRIGRGMYEWAAKVDEYTRGMIGPPGSTLFEELGLYYIGPVDGHNIEDLICVLHEVASLDSTGPVLVHVITKEDQEPKNLQQSDISNKQEEGSSKSDSFSSSSSQQTYGDRFVEALIMEAERDKDIVAVHAGMGMEKSLHLFREKFPDRFFEVGMAEQHAVTFSAGLACGGLKPFCIIPSAFLQIRNPKFQSSKIPTFGWSFAKESRIPRKGEFLYPFLNHTENLARGSSKDDRQKIPVRFVITSAGLVGSDGPTQCGAFDVAFMSCLPNMIVMAPSDEVELVNMVATASQIDDRPVCFRYPRGALVQMNDDSICTGTPIEIGKGRVLIEGKDIALLGYGAMVQNCLRAHSLLSKLGIDVTVADARFCKPLDINLVRQLCENHSFLITVEEGSVGGFGSHVAQFITLDGQLDGKVKWRPIVLPDHYIEHASPEEQLALAGLTGHHIAATALSLLGRTREALLLMR